MSEEIKNIMYHLGRPSIDGDVRGIHLGKVLIYLAQIKEESLEETIYKLGLILGINSRYVRENYLKGLMYFGVIKLYSEGNNTRWKWIGEKAFNGFTLDVIPPPPPREQLKQEIQNITEKLEKEGIENPVTETIKKLNRCKNPECNNFIPSTLNYCNKSCLEKHLEIKKGNKA